MVAKNNFSKKNPVRVRKKFSQTIQIFFQFTRNFFIQISKISGKNPENFKKVI